MKLTPNLVLHVLLLSLYVNIFYTNGFIAISLGMLSEVLHYSFIVSKRQLRVFGNFFRQLFKHFIF